MTPVQRQVTNSLTEPPAPVYHLDVLKESKLRVIHPLVMNRIVEPVGALANLFEYFYRIETNNVV